MKISGILLVAAALLLAPMTVSAQLTIYNPDCAGLPTAFVGSLYTATVRTTGCTVGSGGMGGVGAGCLVVPYSVELTAIGLAQGSASLGSGNITISGTPTMSGSFPFTLTISDWYAGTTDSCTGTLVVEVPIHTIPPQYLRPGEYVYNGGTTTGAAPGEQYDTLGNSTATYYVPGGGGGGGDGSSSDCFVSSATSGSLLGMGSLVAIALCGFLFLRRS